MINSFWKTKQMSVKPLFNDQELLARMARRDEHAFRLLYDHYRKWVYTYALRMLQSPELAEEVMQEIFAQLWSIKDNAEGITNLEAYLRTSTRNRSLNILRRLSLEKRTQNKLTGDWQEDHNETEELILLHDARKILNEGVSLLPQQQQRVYQLCQQQGLGCEEAARQLDISPLTVKSHLQLAIRTLRKYMNSHGDLAMLLIIFGLK
jgi:RNA polymerase sigma-70 factor (ECF subfamily)